MTDLLLVHNAVDISTVLVAIKTLTLLLGGLITFFAYKAYARTRARPLGLLALGFAVITVGSLLAGIVHLGLPAERETAILLESSTIVLGFAVIVYSLYAQ